MREFPDTVGERAVRRCAGGFFLTVYVGMSDSGGAVAGLRRGGGGIAAVRRGAAGEIVYYRMLSDTGALDGDRAESVLLRRAGYVGMRRRFGKEGLGAACCRKR